MFYRKNIRARKILALLSMLLMIFIAFIPASCKKAFSPGSNAGESLKEEEVFEILRYEMVSKQIVDRGVTDEITIEAMKKVPRHRFVSSDLQKNAYTDRPLPIGEGQTISQPYVVALMTENLELDGSEKVLEIGTGSGYQAAVLAEIADEVYTVEIVTSLYLTADRALASYNNVTTSNHDGYYGWEEHAPFDRIMVTAAPDHIPPPLIDQLTDGGIMVLPVGPPGFSQTLWKVIKSGDKVLTVKITDYVAFVPLTREVR